MQMRDEGGAAGVLKCSKALLRRMRREGRGPRWTRVGRLVRYSDEWLREYLENNAAPAGKDRQKADTYQRGK